LEREGEICSFLPRWTTKEIGRREGEALHPYSRGKEKSEGGHWDGSGGSHRQRELLSTGEGKSTKGGSHEEKRSLDAFGRSGKGGRGSEERN